MRPTAVSGTPKTAFTERVSASVKPFVAGPDQGPEIDVALQHPGVEWRAQLAIAESQLGLGDLRLRVVHGGLGALILGAGVVEVGLRGCASLV